MTANHETIVDDLAEETSMDLFNNAQGRITGFEYV